MRAALFEEDGLDLVYAFCRVVSSLQSMLLTYYKKGLTQVVD